MFDAQWLPAGTTIFSPWFPRGGDNLRATVEAMKFVGARTLKVRVFTKAADTAGDGQDASWNGSASTVEISISSAGRATAQWLGEDNVGLLDLVRYEFIVDGSTAGEGVLFRMLDPVWFDTTVAGLT